MKKLQSVKSALVVAGLAALAMAVPASAQTNLRFDIPFAFAVGNQVLPAGEYTFNIDPNYTHCHIDSRSDGSIHAVHLLPGGGGRKTADVSTGVVQFQKIGDRYFLSQIFRPGYTDGLATYMSHRLMESAKNEAGSGAAGEAVNLYSAIK